MSGETMQVSDRSDEGRPNRERGQARLSLTSSAKVSCDCSCGMASYHGLSSIHLQRVIVSF